MATVVSYLPFNLSYNATILVTLFFPYRAWAEHQWVEDKIAEEVESRSLILQLATSYLTETFLLSEVTSTTQDALQGPIIDVHVNSKNA